MSAGFHAGLEPSRVGFPKSAEGSEVEKGSRVEKDKHDGGYSKGRDDIIARPILLRERPAWAGRRGEFPNQKHGHGKNEATDVEDIGFLGEDHSGDGCGEKE